MYDLAKSDSIRLASGKIMEVEAIQSKLEADIMYNEVLQAETDLKQAYMQLSLLSEPQLQIRCFIRWKN